MLKKMNKVKINPRKITLWFYIIVIFLTIIILSIVSMFLYKNFYETIAQSKEIIILKEKVALEMVDIDKFNKIMENITKKISQKRLENITSPFH